LKDLLDDLDLMNRENIALPVNKIIGKSSGVQFMTAYGAKGLEFDYVFIIKVVENLWEKKSGNNSNFSIIPGIVKTVEDGSEEDQRRLFYVALTRAKDYVYITYSTENEENKPLVRSKFVEELVSVDEVPIKKVVDDDSIEAYKAELMKNNQGQAVLIDLELADQLLESFTLSITHLNKYISCPTRFYFESLLRVPSGRNASMGYGSAMHHAMQFFIGDIKLTEPKSIGSLEKFKEYFEQGIELFHSHFTDKERANYLRAGKYNLELYYEKYKQEWFKPKSYETEYKIDQILHRNVPINGVFDRIDVYSDFVEVIDYKTGDFTSTYTKVKLEKPSEKQPNGGDYWRQIVFYRILLDEEKRHKWHMTSGTIDFLEEQKEELKKVKIVVSPEDIKFVSDLIVDVNQKIKAKIFSPGCGDAKCQWCNFVKAHMPANLADGDVDEMGEG
jgi:DNA helicase II / ATP-dependent DNA helicase PcrA